MRLHALLLLIAAGCLPGAATPAAAAAADPELVSVVKIWDAGEHNAFTDLVRYRDEWFCVFRESEAHVGGDGRIRVITSPDGDRWTSAALLAEPGVDLRDPKLSITPDGRLMLVMGGSIYEGKKYLGRQPRVAFSGDGREWSTPRRVMAEGDWLWRVTWHDGLAYGTSYNNTEPAAEAGQTRPNWPLVLYSSRDGIHYEKVTALEVNGSPNETTLRFMENGDMLALVRREGAAPDPADKAGWIGRSRPPYRQWEWHALDARLGGPDFIRLPDGSLWAGTRWFNEDKSRSTVLARMTPDSLSPVVKLPSGGDTSYPGLAWHEGQIWMSYYSSHEGKSCIYLARFRLPGAAQQ